LVVLKNTGCARRREGARRQIQQLLAALRAAAAANCSALSTAVCAIIFLCQLSKKVALAASLGCSFGLFDCFWFGFLDLIFDFFLIVVASGLRPAPGRHPPLHPFVPTIASPVGGDAITGPTSNFLYNG
jgi:hypothetical protein